MNSTRRPLNVDVPAFCAADSTDSICCCGVPGGRGVGGPAGGGAAVVGAVPLLELPHPAARTAATAATTTRRSCNRDRSIVFPPTSAHWDVAEPIIEYTLFSEPPSASAENTLTRSRRDRPEAALRRDRMKGDRPDR